MKGLSIKGQNVSNVVNHNLIKNMVFRMQDQKTKKVSIPQETFKITKNHQIKTVRTEKILRSDVNDKRFLLPSFSPYVTLGFGSVCFERTNNYINFQLAQKSKECAVE